MRSFIAQHRTLVAAASIVVACCLGAIALAVWHTAGVEVVLVNNTGHALRDVRIYYIGGIVTVPKLQAGDSFRTAVCNETEGGVYVEFADDAGRPHQETIGGYLGSYSRGRIDVDFRANGRVTCKEQLSTSMLGF
ncbi:MAG: hypothetical protein LLG00_01560 [Planctomycetaceae bacterium]|nr:hypothetical protein [Planctomycetaceae bacterium]